MILSMTEIGLSRNEARQYSLTRAINQKLEAQISKKKFEGLEADVSEAIARRLGESPGGFYVPDLATRTQTATDAASGGNLVGNVTIGTIPALRNDMHVARMGAQILDFDAIENVGMVEIPRVSTGAQVEHLGETETSAGSALNVDQLTMVPHRTFAKLVYSRRLFSQTGGGVDVILEADMHGALGEDIDKMALIGTGTDDQPAGVLNQPGVPEVTFSGAPTWAKVLDIEKACAIRAGGSYGFITTGDVRKAWKETAKVSGSDRFIWEKGRDGDPAGYGEVAGYHAAATDNMTGDKVAFGNWKNLLIGIYGAIDVLPDPYSLINQGKLALNCTLYYDIGLRHSESFCRSTDSAAQ